MQEQEKVRRQNTERNTGSAEKSRHYLPAWDLSDLYTSLTDEALAKDQATLEKTAADFVVRYSGKIRQLSGAELAEAVALYESIGEGIGKITAYAYLSFSTHRNSPEYGAFYQKIVELATDISAKIVFFTLDLNALTEEETAEKLKDAALQKYAAWLRDLRVFKPHMLSEELEQFQAEMSTVGSLAWVRLFDETLAAVRVSLPESKSSGRLKTVSLNQALELLSDSDREVRKNAAKAVGESLAGQINLFTFITNTLAKDKEISDRRRQYKSPETARNLQNMVEDSVIEALVQAVESEYPTLSHRYYRLKAEKMGLPYLEYWDRNAPLADEEEEFIPWEKAKETVLGAYYDFSPQMAEIGEKFFKNNWIDAKPSEGKDGGAFAHPTVTTAHPYILMNYYGKSRDVMTLAHELGHGIHQVLAAGQGGLLSETPLILAETASIFGEMLTFQALLRQEQDLHKRHILLRRKVEDMLNTVVRQIAFYRFEKEVHHLRREGELSPQFLGEIWMNIQKNSLGDAFHFDETYQNYWAYIPHFIHSPFYVYAYAFGDCLVNALYAVYCRGDSGFSEKYIDMLRAGGSKRHGELLAPFGLSATDPGFWKLGLGTISGFIDELSASGKAKAGKAGGVKLNG